MQCVKCKKDIPDNSIYCNYCGKKQQTEKRRARRRANGQGSVVKLNGTRSKPFMVRLPAGYDDDGYCTRQVLGFYETKTEALNALNNAVSNGVTDRVNATFKQVFDDWSAQSFKELSDSTITNYTTSFKHLKQLHNKKMKDLRAKDVQAIIDKLGAETGRKTNMLYSQLCKYAMSIDLISQNYGGELSHVPELPRQADTALERIAYVAEVNRLKKPFASVDFNKQETWENPLWGLNGEHKEEIPDPSRGSVLTIQYYDSEDGGCRTALASVSGQVHECRKHSIENAWKFISHFTR